MPIRFRCSYCNRLLGIATRKAGMETTCPHCGYVITVPVPQEDDGRTERMNLDDVDAMLGKGATEVVQPPSAVAARPAPPPAEKPRAEAPKPPASIPPPKARTAPSPKPASSNPDDPPLFERDVDEIFGNTAVPVEDDREKRPKISGMDAMSLGEPAHQIVISSQKATLLMILVVVLLVIAFAAGYFLAPKG